MLKVGDAEIQDKLSLCSQEVDILVRGCHDDIFGLQRCRPKETRKQARKQGSQWYSLPYCLRIWNSVTPFMFLICLRSSGWRILFTSLPSKEHSRILVCA